MAKEVHHHPKDAHEEAPLSETARHPKLMDQDDHASADKLQSLKSLNAMLLKETSDRRPQVDSLEHAKSALESELARFSAELGRAGRENVGLVLEKGVLCTFSKTQMGEMSARIDGLIEEKREKKETIEKLEEKNDSVEKLLKVVEKKLEEKERLMDRLVRKKLEIKEGNYCEQNEIDGLLREVGELKNEVTELVNKCDAAVEKEEEMARRIDGLIEEKREKKETIEKLDKKNDSVEKLLKVVQKKLEEKERLMDRLVRKKLEIEEGNYCEQNEIDGLLREVGELKNEVTELENKCDAAEEEMARRIDSLIEEKREKKETSKKLDERNDSVERLLKVVEKKLEKGRLMNRIVRKKLEIEEGNYCEQNEIDGLLREVGELKNEITGLESSFQDQVDKNKALLGEISSSRETCDQVTLERENVQKSLDEEKQNAMNLRELEVIKGAAEFRSNS